MGRSGKGLALFNTDIESNVLLQAPTAAIAESGGDVLLSGAIIDYLVTFISGDPVVVNCASANCTSSATRLTDGTNLFIGVAARNAITQGEASQVLCESCYCLIACMACT